MEAPEFDCFRSFFRDNGTATRFWFGRKPWCTTDASAPMNERSPSSAPAATIASHDSVDPAQEETITRPAGGPRPMATRSFLPDATSAGRPSVSDTDLVFGPPFSPCEFDRYTLLEILGEGGMGVVYKAYDPNLERYVALKKIAPRAVGKSEDMTRFRAEAKAAAKFDHRHIVTVYDVDVYNGEHYFTMTLVAGGTLAEAREQFSRDRIKAVTCMAKVARAVAYAHDLGVVHRDLKPHNVLLDEHDEPRVTDFGLAKILGSETAWNDRGKRMGTPGYMSPEQAKGDSDRVGPPADIWSLGVMLYELLTGRRPFDAGDRESLTTLICTGDLPGSASPSQGMPPELETVVLRCLRKNPAERYASAAQMADDLEKWLEGQGAPIKRERSRRRGYVEMAMALLVALPLLVGLMMIGYYQMLRPPRVVVETIVQDPNPPLADGLRLRDRLLAGEKLTLIGATGGPKWWNVRTQRDREPLRVAADYPMGLTTGRAHLLELVPDVQARGWRLKAELMHASNIDGWVGIYFGHREFVSGPSMGHWFWVARFSTAPPVSSTQLAACRFCEDRAVPRSTGNTIGAFRLGFNPDNPLAWVEIRLDVTDQGVEGYLNNDLFWKYTWQEMAEMARPGPELREELALAPHAFPFPEDKDVPVLDGLGGIGLYLMRADGKFRNVTIELIPQR